MACGQSLGSLDAFERLTVLSTSIEQFFPTTDWLPCTGLQARAWINMLDEGGDGVEARPAVQYAQVVTDQPSTNGGRGDWSGLGSAIDSEGIHAFGDLTIQTQYQFVRFGIGAKKGSGTGFGQADISALIQVKPCGKDVGSSSAAGIEADGTREIPVSDWFVTVDVTNCRIGYLLDADSAFKVDWFIQTANDTNRPSQPVTLGQSQVSGSGAGTYVSGNTGDINISGTMTPALASNTPAFARVMARISSSSGSPVSADQLLVSVQVS